MKEIKKILIANRGEIAVRIIKAAKELDILTVAVYSDTDRTAEHVKKADEVYRLKNEGTEPYLDIEQIIEAAHRSQSDAVHPGYGFLSENHFFAERVTREGFIFIGPPYKSVKLMGDKSEAKKKALQAGVQVIPGFEVDYEKDSETLLKTKQIGYPILIKARAGGGGKGMRVVENEEQLQTLLEQSVREAKDAFGDGRVLIEKYFRNPRHIEIQVLADNYGNVVHLFERECSIQRRHQKVIEEAPSFVITDDLRAEMGNKAVKLTKVCGYTNAGTIEFILDENQKFYFLEMNTRLQVEHPVTEFITGLDLVKQQIRIAEGEKLQFTQEDLKITGHAIELRVCAEDPMNSFLPDTGTLTQYDVPKGIGIRVDDGYKKGDKIPIEYDPLIGKLIVYGSDRNEAIAKMKRAIDDFKIEGVKNTLEFGRFVMDNPDFISGGFDTGFISKNEDEFKKQPEDKAETLIAAVAAYQFIDMFEEVKANTIPEENNRWRARRK